ncbi:unnamed protein product [Oppiella nova]|uniref:Uncharacterized protein n=1 Tax=Oppiella nova TaxID=334625 RepID=A0A7R9M832_9ACAR|nr:unnamed protein product [Oppiella nova]CAG2171377.1 unnamed protein product [Oppiella nova]
MYFNISDISVDRLLQNCVKFSLDLVKTNIKKTVSDRAVRAVKGLVFRGKKPVKKNRSIHLKAGDSVTFVVKRHGLQAMSADDDSDRLLVPDMMVSGEPIGAPIVCDHHFPGNGQQYCEICLKSQLKSKL